MANTHSHSASEFYCRSAGQGDKNQDEKLLVLIYNDITKIGQQLEAKKKLQAEGERNVEC